MATQRRLTDSVAQLIDAVEASGLAGSCMLRLPSRNGQDGWVTILTDRGPVGVSWGPTRRSVRAMTVEQNEALDLLAERLTDIDAWLGEDAWLEPSARPWLADAWSVVVYRDIAMLSNPYPEASGIVLADGTEPLRILTANGEGSRCTMLSAALAADLVRKMEALGAPRQQHTQWLLRDGAQDLMVDLKGLRPGEPGCGAAPDAQPSIPPATEPPSLFNDDVQSCGFLDRESASAILGPVTPGKSLGGSLIADSVMCTYDAAGQAEPQAIINVRRLPTPAGEAATVARAVFGDHGLAMTSSAGRAAFLNGCVSADGSCTPAIAVSAEPWFVVILVPRSDGPVEEAPETERRLRALAAALDFPARP